MLYLKRLRTILQSKLFYILLICTTILFTIYFIKIKNHRSVYNITDTMFIGTITDINIYEDYFSVEITNKEKLNAIYYYDKIETQEDFIRLFSLGDKIKIIGQLKLPSNNTNPNQFNYKKYLNYNYKYYILNIKEYEIIQKNNNIFYKIKNKIYERLEENNKVNKYIKAFVLGDNNIDRNMKNIYQNIGVSHLLAISGMHVSLLIGSIYKILKRFNINDYVLFIVIGMLMFFYMFLTNFTASILRSGVLFLITRFSNLFKCNLSVIKCFILTICILILLNPFIIYNIGFIFSSVISGYLILFSDLINKRKNYFSKLFITSLIAWLISFPIVIYNFFEVNLLSVIYNIVCVPFVSYIIFPMSFITLIFRRFYAVFNVLIEVLEKFGGIVTSISSTFIFKKPILIIVIIYFIFITIALLGIRYKKYYLFFPLLIIGIIHYNYNLLFRSSYMLALDVGQGDCILLHIDNKTILIDVGGHSNYEKNKKLYDTIEGSIKSLGIKKIDCFLITHGDFDHMGEAINLVENFKVEKVIFNCGEFNELEQDLIKVLDKKKIPYYSCIKELNIDDNKLYFLNNKDYGNENDNSSVIYTELNNHKFLFMGDAGVGVEEDLIKKYNLQDIDVLKVGHHGSKTSSGEEFIYEINPKYSIISVGKNNRYGHPNDSVLDNLYDSKIYRTDQDGSIMFKLKNNKLEIETCTP